MNLVVKTRAYGPEEPEEQVRRALSAASRSGSGQKLQVAKLFPAARAGNRGRMVRIDIPDEISAAELERLRSSLEQDPCLEYVHEPTPKHYLHTP